MTENDNVNRRVVEQIAVDYCVECLSDRELRDKYNISHALLKHIVKKLNLKKQREKYAQMVLEKSLKRCSTHQSKILTNITELFASHVTTLHRANIKNGHGKMDSTDIRDLLAIYTVISKDHRLDNNKATENIVKTVEVVLPEGLQPVTQNTPAIEDKSNEDPEAEEVKDLPDVEVDSEVLGGIVIE